MRINRPTPTLPTVSRDGRFRPRRIPLGLVAVGAVLLLLLPACGGKGGNGNVNGTGDGGNGPLDGTGNGAIGSNAPPALPPFTNPWSRASVGDAAVYLTPRAPEEGERWELIEEGSVRITRGTGTDEMGYPIERTDIVPVGTLAEVHWWSLPRPSAEPTGTHTLADGTVLPTWTLTDGSRTWVVSPDAPFDGVVRETIAGREEPVRQLVSFTRAE